MTDFTCNSNEALELTLVRPKEDFPEGSSQEDFVFSPTFTYPIYGEEETIYGYKDLKIQLQFASGSLTQYLSVSYSKKLPSSTADDVEGILYKFIPTGMSSCLHVVAYWLINPHPTDYLKDHNTFLQRVEKDAREFKPPGTKIYSYTPPDVKDDEVTFEVYHSRWETPGFRDYHRRMQIFILLYIEAGSYIEEDEDRWEFLSMFEKRRRKDGSESYNFVGYTSLYPFWCYPDKIRLRLSQFVILPPYQRQSLGSELYTALYQHVLSREDVTELTVEDPAEAFEDLRDKNDLMMLLGHTKFMEEGFGPVGGGKMGPPADRKWVEKWRKDMKIAGRQFQRTTEMLIQRSLPPGDEEALKRYRLQVKERLFRFNFEQLMQLEKEEQLEKLEETFQTVRADYERLLALVK